MNIDELKNEIEKIGYLKNTKIGSFFKKKYPKLFNDIKENTKLLNNSLMINRCLRSRVIFLYKYNLDITKIKVNNKWLTFDRKYDDFLDKSGDYIKRGWDNIKNNIPNEYYSKDETIKILKEDNYYKNFFGKSKNRTLLKENPKLYKSIYKHTEFMDCFNKNNNKFSIRILVLVKNNGIPENIKCEKCKENFTSFNYKTFLYNKLCYKCFHFNNKYKFPQIGWFKSKYPNTWKIEYDNHFLNCYPTLNWFKINYPDTWKEEHDEFSNKLILNLQNNGLGFSKISQEIFWLIYDKLTDEQKKETFFKELNFEWYVRDDGNFYFADFKCKNKIIEFDGLYWHRNTQEKDQIRNNIYKNKNFQIMIINEKDLLNGKNKIGDEIINKCIKFINEN